jgi:hypothetical protein
MADREMLVRGKVLRGDRDSATITITTTGRARAYSPMMREADALAFRLLDLLTEHQIMRMVGILTGTLSPGQRGPKKRHRPAQYADDPALEQPVGWPMDDDR